MILVGRHPSTTSIAQHFSYDHLQREDLKAVSKVIHDAAEQLIALVPDGPELSVALRKLLEGKDAAVRAAL